MVLKIAKTNTCSHYTYFYQIGNGHHIAFYTCMFIRCCPLDVLTSALLGLTTEALSSTTCARVNVMFGMYLSLYEI